MNSYKILKMVKDNVDPNYISLTYEKTTRVNFWSSKKQTETFNRKVTFTFPSSKSYPMFCDNGRQLYMEVGTQFDDSVKNFMCSKLLELDLTNTNQL